MILSWAIVGDERSFTSSIVTQTLRRWFFELKIIQVPFRRLILANILLLIRLERIRKLYTLYLLSLLFYYYLSFSLDPVYIDRVKKINLISPLVSLFAN